MKNIESISILGLGLIGGSLAKAIKEKTDIQNIYAYSRTYKDVELAAREGFVTKTFKDINKEFLSTDILFICTPVEKTLEYLTHYADEFGEGTIITDVGSTKNMLSSHAKKLKLKNFIGGHPMAGSEKTGYTNSIPHLFENAFYILTDNEDLDKEQLKKMISIVSMIGAIPIVLNADDHDFITASISHVPHIMAAALVNYTKELNTKDNNIERLAAGGFKDTTRIASSSPAMWQSICVQNSENIKKILDGYIKELGKVSVMIEKVDPKEIYKYFENAKDFRDSIKDRSRGSYVKTYDVSIDIEDKPGSISKVANILSEHNINVKNINIPGNREFEDGCLIVTFEDEQTRIHALSALNKKNVKAYKRG